jgi:poly(3-hydroxyalkanoate) depolymerase
VESPGAGRPLLLINGIGASGDLFEPFRAHLGDRTTIAFDAPGVGGSQTPTFTPSMKRLADIVAEMCDGIAAGPVDVLGVSWGGMLAQELARRHPAKVRRLVLVATCSGWTSVPGNLGSMSHLLTPMRYFSADNLRRNAVAFYGEEIREQPDLLERQIELRLAHRPSWMGYMHQLNALTGWSSLGWIHQLEQPTLVMAGDDDPMIPIANARLLANRIPKARLHVAEGGGHLFLFTRAAKMSAVVTDFLDS